MTECFEMQRVQSDYLLMTIVVIYIVLRVGNYAGFAQLYMITTTAVVVRGESWEFIMALDLNWTKRKSRQFFSSKIQSAYLSKFIRHNAMVN